MTPNPIVLDNNGEKFHKNDKMKILKDVKSAKSIYQV